MHAGEHPINDDLLALQYGNVAKADGQADEISTYDGQSERPRKLTGFLLQQALPRRAASI